MRPRFPLACATFAVISAAMAIPLSPEAHADALFSASTTAGLPQQGTTAVSTSGQHHTGGFDTTGSAHASPGSVGASAQANFFDVGDFSGEITLPHFSQARMVIDDIVISGPDDEVMVSLNLVIAGHLSAMADAISGPGALSTGEASASVTFIGRLGETQTFFFPEITFDGQVNVRQRRGNEVPDITTVTASGVFGDISSTSSSGYSIMGSGFTTESFLVEVGDELTLDLQLNVGAAAGFNTRFAGGRSVTANGTSSFGNTISFPTFGPVFNLPAGFTVNSAQGNIVDNRFGVQQAPEPGSVALLAAGLMGLGLGRLRTRRLRGIRRQRHRRD